MEENDEAASFMAYWEAVDAAMVRLFGIDTGNAGIEADELAAAQEACQSPEDYARAHGERYGLTLRSEWERW